MTTTAEPAATISTKRDVADLLRSAAPIVPAVDPQALLHTQPDATMADLLEAAYAAGRAVGTVEGVRSAADYLDGQHWERTRWVEGLLVLRDLTPDISIEDDVMWTLLGWSQHDDYDPHSDL